jgi:hypothetical protein
MVNTRACGLQQRTNASSNWPPYEILAKECQMGNKTLTH